MRALLAELRPSTLTDAELGDLLRLLVKCAHPGRTNIPTTLTVVRQGQLPSEVQVALYRLCQEGLNNIAKHAGASRVEINLKQEEKAMELIIRDYGRGLILNRPPGHYGYEHDAVSVPQRWGRCSPSLASRDRARNIVIRWQELSKRRKHDRIPCSNYSSNAGRRPC